MSTNYYLRERRPSEAAISCLDGDGGSVSSGGDRRGSFHICKLSWGWRPLMVNDPDSRLGLSFGSLREVVDFIRVNSETFGVFDEYGDELSADEFDSAVRGWGRSVAVPADGLLSWHEKIDFVDDEGFEFCSDAFC